MQPPGMPGRRLSGQDYFRSLAALLTASFVLVGGLSILDLLQGNVVQHPPGTGEAGGGGGVAHERGEIILTCSVTGIEIAGTETHVNGFCDTMPKLWIVRFRVVGCLRGSFLSLELNVLTHSPSRDLGVRSMGQQITLSLRKASGYPPLPWPPSSPRPIINFVGIENLYEVSQADR